MDAEYQQLLDRDVYTYVDHKPPEAAIVGSFFVLKAVTDAEGKLIKYKARLVAMGSHQPTSTYDEIKSPTSRTSTVKLVLNISVIVNRRCRGYDVPGAYLHSETDKAVSTKGNPNIYVRFPNKKIARLNKFLYGLKQSGLEWFETHKRWILSLGFKQSPTEPCLYLWREHDVPIGEPLQPTDKFIILLVYVDDDLLLASSEELETWFQTKIIEEYGRDVKVKCDDFTFLGMKVSYDTNMCTIAMPGYIDKLVELAKASHLTPVPTPETVVTSDTLSTEKADTEFYQMLLGTINYLATMCRPDILNAVSRLSTAAFSPTVSDMDKLMRVIRYLKGTRNDIMRFTRTEEERPRLECYADASFGCHIDSKSHSGYCCYLNRGSAAFYAKSSKQQIVTLSSAEAECVALSEVLTEIIWIRNVLADIGMPQSSPTIVHEDNTATIAITRGAGKHSKVKHFDRRVNFNRDAVDRGIISLQYCNTEAQTADILTKALPKGQFDKLKRNLLVGIEGT
jgi:hypothetical protein